jgi:electron transport complex protein RnfE
MGLLQDFTDKPLKTNPVFVLALGLCPTLAVSTTLKNAFWMAVAATAVLIGSNVIIAAVKKLVPKDVRIPCFIVVIASFVTMVETTMQGLMPEMHKTLGIFIPLIVVNCIIIGRAEAFASRNSVLSALMDALGIGVGYMLAMLLLGGIREFVGTGQLTLPIPLDGMARDLDFTRRLFTLRPGVKPAFKPLQILTLSPGAFLVIGVLFGFFNVRKARKRRRQRDAHPRLAPQTAADFAAAKAAKAAKDAAAGKEGA